MLSLIQIDPGVTIWTDVGVNEDGLWSHIFKKSVIGFVYVLIWTNFKKIGNCNVEPWSCNWKMFGPQIYRINPDFASLGGIY